MSSITEFKPPINDRDTDELIAIANSKNDSWQEEAKRQAKEELIKRGVSEEQQAIEVNKWEKEIEKIDKEYQIQLEKNELESYRAIDMVVIFLLSPVIFLGKFEISLGKSLSELKAGNYKIKYRQRLVSLIGGVLFWIALIKIILNMEIPI